MCLEYLADGVKNPSTNKGHLIANQLLTRHSPLAPLSQVDE